MKKTRSIKVATGNKVAKHAGVSTAARNGSTFSNPQHKAGDEKVTLEDTKSAYFFAGLG
jgi:hypothetical protein